MKQNEDETKECRECKVKKPLDEFHWKVKAKGIKQNVCKPCAIAYQVQNRPKVKDAFNAKRRKRYAEDEAFRAQRAAEGRARYAANREQRAAKERERYRSNRDKIRTRRRFRYATDETYREKEKAYKRRREAIKRGALSLGRGVKVECPEHLCYWCGIDLNTPGIKTHIDHIMPLCLHGPDEDFNKVPTCSGCNMSKGPKHPLVWIARMF